MDLTSPYKLLSALMLLIITIKGCLRVKSGEKQDDRKLG